MKTQNHVLVLSSQADLPFAITDHCASFLDNRNVKLEKINILGDKGLELIFASDFSTHLAELREQLKPLEIDANLCSTINRRKKLLIADMDATIITSECIDELASIHGISDQIKAITSKAMQGELDFDSSLRARVRLLCDLPTKAIEIAYRDKVSLTAGAQTLIQTMNTFKATTVLASGGFTCFAERIAQRVGFHHCHANKLDIADGRLTGKIIEPILGKESKKTILQQYMRDLKIKADDTIAVGDGANDEDMIKAASFGVAFNAKPSLRQHTPLHIDHSDLTALLFLQGYREEEFVRNTI
ncbi:phosphoserine phosphatase SerB [uncultured Kiloniella sp.]|mgnify:CR=1 FL=1|uniref:phosphoserine phosphatase SerB n=1 Tax=uncultured Kiloniella sp. TaxID=1133091 RepID=UPI00261754D5|nr:phosphoserine phosphatase SerB [uncultured Kiloniella sp.]